MALSDIRTQIRIEIGGRLDLDDVIDDQVNFAVQEICTMYDFEELHGEATATTSNLQAHYRLPSDCYALWSVKEETVLNKELERKDIRAFHEYDETQTGVPHAFATYAKRLVLFNQVPDTNSGANYTIRIRYWKKHASLVLDADSLVIPFEWERGVRLKATGFMFSILDMDDKATQKQTEFDRWASRFMLPKAAELQKAKYARVYVPMEGRR